MSNNTEQTKNLIYKGPSKAKAYKGTQAISFGLEKIYFIKGNIVTAKEYKKYILEELENDEQ